MGRTANAALVSPVGDARMILAAFFTDESIVHQLRERLESVFDAWKVKHGTLPDESHGGLLGSPYDGKTIAECPPYVCAGSLVRNYADLLAKLRAEAFEPLSALDKENGPHIVSALLVLSEAANGRIESAVKAHWEIQRHNSEIEAQEKQRQANLIEKILPLVKRGVPFSKAGSQKKGREYEPKSSIRKICTSIQSTKFDDVLNELRDADKCADLYESTFDPIGVLFTAVDDDTQTISYLLRGELPDNQKQITFKRLWGILTEIKK